MTPMLLLQGLKPNRSKAAANNRPDQKEEVSNMRKRVMALTASAIMAAMMVAGSAGPAFASSFTIVVL